MNLLIIEDEALIAVHLVKLLRELHPDWQVLKIITSVKEGLAEIPSLPVPDLVLSDIQLSDGTSFEIFHGLNLSVPVIFTTAYDEYAIRAFQLNSIGYLLKPIDKDELTAAMEKFLRLRHQQGPLPEQLYQLLADIGNPQGTKYKERFLAHHLNHIIPVGQDEVACFRKDQLIYIVTKDNKEYLTDYETLEQIEELVDPRRFFRANRQHIVQSNAIAGFKTGLNGKLTLRLVSPLQFTIDISREKAQAFKTWFA